MKPAKAFRITDGKGFQIRLANGWTVSVQFGRYNYCDNRDYAAGWNDPESGACDTAEIAAWNREGKFCRHVFGGKQHDEVAGWQTPDDFVRILNNVASMGQICADCLTPEQAREEFNA